MDRIFIVLALIGGLFYLLLKNKDSLTGERVKQIIVAMLTFALCFPRLAVPLARVAKEGFGSLGPTYRLEPWFVFFFVLLIIIAKEKAWRVTRPRGAVLLVFVAYSVYVMLNPNNVVMPSSLAALFYLVTFLIFLYLFVQCFSLSTIVAGIYEGFKMTVVLHLVLAVLFPVMGISAIVQVFNADAVVRSTDRIGTPGTFGHPNILGAYASYYFVFFFSCFITRYRRKESLSLFILALIVIFLTGSRSALVAAALAAVVIVGLYLFRQHRVFSPSTILKGWLPLAVILAVAWYLSPVSELFTDLDNIENMSYARFMHYYCAGEIISDHPVLGVGLNSHLRYLLDNSALIDIEKAFETADVEIWDPETFMFHNPIHNIWLILICELGILGALPIIVYVGHFFYMFKRRVAKIESQDYHVVICTALGIAVCIIVHGMSDWTPLTQPNLNVSLLFIYMTSYYVRQAVSSNESLTLSSAIDHA